MITQRYNNITIFVTHAHARGFLKYHEKGFFKKNISFYKFKTTIMVISLYKQ